MQGNQPLAREMRGDMATQEFAELIAPYFPLFLPKLGSVQDDADEEVGTNSATLQNTDIS